MEPGPTGHWLPSGASSGQAATADRHRGKENIPREPRLDLFSIVLNFSCVVSRLCVPNMEYQFVNPTTQVSLFSQCLPLCTAINNITWTVYQGIMNASSNIVRWTPYPGMKQYENIWFYGNSSMLMICMSFFSPTGYRHQLQQLHCHQSVVSVQSDD